MSSLINSALSGLNAAQAALTVTSNNTANVNTPGYSRQEVILSSSFSVNRGFGFVGSGVSIDNIRRAYDRFLTQQANVDRTRAAYYDNYSTEVGRMLDALGSPETSFNASLNNFYAAVQDFSVRPTEAASGMLASASAMAYRMQSVSEQLQQIQKNTNNTIEANINRLNQLSKSIADLNISISTASRSNSGQYPNDLLDQRDQLVREVNELVGASEVVQDGSQINLFMSNGQPLVVGSTPSVFTTAIDPGAPGGMSLSLQTTGRPLVLRTEDITGGAIGALLSFRDNELQKTQVELGRIAIALTANYNQQQQFGINADGVQGPPMFAIGPPLVSAATFNKFSVQTTAEIVESRDLQPSNYEISFDGYQYTVLRTSDNFAQTFPFGGGSDELVFDGVKITFDTSTLNAGDSFHVDMTTQAAAGLRLLLTDPRQIAGAAPMQLDVDASNSGSVSASRLRSDASTAPNVYDISMGVVFTSSTSYEIYALDANGNPTGTALSNGAYVQPRDTVRFNGWAFDVEGFPNNGDIIRVDAMPGDPSGDNRNAVSFALLSSALLIDDRTLTSSYANFIAEVGSRGQELQVLATSSKLTFETSNLAELSNSGVNLDEEAANLIRYQQAYAAASKVLTTAVTLFDSFLAAIR